MHTILGRVALVWCVSVATAAAQEREFGFKAGANFAVLAFDESDEDYDRRIAPSGGAFLVLPLVPHLAVQIEGLYNSRGAKLFDEDLGATSTLLLDYLDFPVLARVEGARLGNVHLFAGPYFGIRVDATRQISSEGPGFTAGRREDMSREVERFETGLVAGGGVNLARHWLVDVRYTWGFTDVNSDTSDDVHFRSRALTTMIGFRF